MRLPEACVATLAVTIVIGGLNVTPIRAVETTTDKPTVQEHGDKALVYFVRPKRPGSRLTTFLYIDDEFVGILEDNSFTYALVEEGQHVLWTFMTVDVKSQLFKALSNALLPRPWEGTKFEVVSGRTYYFGFVDPDGTRNTHHQLDEKEGADRIDRVKFYATATEEEAQASKVHLSERGPEIVEQFEATYVEIPDHPTPQVPLDLTGLVRVDANSEVSLELVQNLWSERDSSGDEVWFRVTRDLASAEGVWLREGTLVRGILHHAEDRGSRVEGGVLEVAIPAVVAVDSTVVPTQGDIQESGGGVSKGSRAAESFVRALSILSSSDPGPVGGKAAYLLHGSAATIYTRDPVWIAPASKPIESDEEGSSSPALRLRVATREIRFPPRRQSKVFSVLVGRPERPARVRVRSIAGRPPPVEIEARKMTRLPEGWLCAFDWWQVVRFLPLTSEPHHTALEVDGVFEDGTLFVVEVPVDLNGR